jgi:glucokinase
MASRAELAYLGLDVGGTNIKYGLVDAHGAMLWGARVATPATRPVPVLAIKDIAAAALDRAAAAGQTVAGLGVATPGRVNSGSGVVLEATNLDWDRAPLGTLLEDKLGLPVRVLNDTNAAALGEYVAGGWPSPAADLICVSIGTGVGAGLIMGGELYAGENFNAGEIGHVIADPDGGACACGGTGCLETIAAGPGIVRAYQDAMARADGGRPPGPVSLSGVAAAAQAGSEPAIAALTAAATALGIQVANCRSLLDVSHFVISGGVANIDWPLVPEIARVASRYLTAGKRARLQVRKSEMIDRAAIVGAVSYLREHACT